MTTNSILNDARRPRRLLQAFAFIIPVFAYALFTSNDRWRLVASTDAPPPAAERTTVPFVPSLQPPEIVIPPSEHPDPELNTDPTDPAQLENDPVYRQIRDAIRQGKMPDPNELGGGNSTPSEPPSLDPQVASTLSAGQVADQLSSRQWHAIELMLQSARLLDEEASTALAAGNEVKASECSAIARRLRTEVVTLIRGD